MPIFYVEGYESVISMVNVEADNEKEAIEKAWRGDIIEGTQDTDPGKNIWKSKWRASESEEVPWDGRGFGRQTTYRIK